MKSTGFNVLVLGLASVFILAACDRGEKKDSVSNRQLEKAQCFQIASGKFALPQALTDSRTQLLKQDFGNLDEKLVRTYVVKMNQIRDINENGTKDVPLTVLKGNVQIASAKTTSEFEGSDDKISVELFCDTLKANLKAPGLDIKDMDFQVFARIGKAGLDPRKQIMLTKMEEGIGPIRVIVGEYFDENTANAQVVKAESTRKYKTLKLSLTTPYESYEIVQRAGLAKDDKIEFDSSVIYHMAQQLGEQAPEAVKEFIAAGKNSQNNELNKVQPLNVSQSTLSLSEDEVIKLSELLVVQTQSNMDAGVDTSSASTSATGATDASAAQ